MIKPKSWPEYPKAMKVDNQIFIIFEDGSSLCWGEEDSEEKFIEVINDIQNGLRAINFVSQYLKKTIDCSQQVMETMKIPEDKRKEYLNTALTSIIFENNSTNNAISDGKDSRVNPFYIQ